MVAPLRRRVAKLPAPDRNAVAVAAVLRVVVSPPASRAPAAMLVEPAPDIVPAVQVSTDVAVIAPVPVMVPPVTSTLPAVKGPPKVTVALVMRTLPAPATVVPVETVHGPELNSMAAPGDTS